MAAAGIALAGLLWGGYLPIADTTPATPSNSGIIAPENHGIITQGQSGGTNIINQLPHRLVFNDATKAYIISHLSRDEPVDIFGVGSSTDIQTARDIAIYLQNSGYNTTFSGASNFSPAPNQQITVYNQSGRQTLVIAPSVIR